MSRQNHLTAAEEKLAALIWRDAPLTSPELVALAEREMAWKKSTTYTVLKKLCDKGVFRNDNARVSVGLTREEFLARQSCRYVDDAYGGSLPMFLASFTSGRKLSAEQVADIKRLIDSYGEGGGNG